MVLEHIYKIFRLKDDINKIKDEIELQYSDKLNIQNELSDYLEIYYNIFTHYNYDSIVYVNSTEKYEGAIPENILEVISQHNALIIGNYYQVKLDNLPPNIKYINIYSVYNYIHPLNNLPSNLEHLIFNTNYEVSLDYLPNGLKTLALNGYYSIPLHNLPSSIKKLSVGGRYNEPFINLPEGLESLILSEYYQIELQNLPPNLNNLYIGSDYYLPLVNLPDSIETLSISGSPSYIDKLPSRLKILNINFGANFHVKLSDSIEDIYIQSCYSINVLYNLLDEHIPQNLKRILLSPLETYDDAGIINNSFGNNFGNYPILDEIRKKYPDYEVRFA